jgi:hypothetical protein
VFITADQLLCPDSSDKILGIISIEFFLTLSLSPEINVSLKKRIRISSPFPSVVFPDTTNSSPTVYSGFRVSIYIRKKSLPAGGLLFDNPELPFVSNRFEFNNAVPKITTDMTITERIRKE